MNTEKQHWIIRVSDGVNFRNSRYPFWGVKCGKYDCMKGIVKKFKKGDILWFQTSKKYGGKIIAMSEYTSFHDRADEPLVQINTKTNEEQHWQGGGDWDIQINYCNLYITEKQNIKCCFRCPATINNYNTFKDRITENLYNHYQNFIYYAEPKLIN